MQKMFEATHEFRGLPLKFMGDAASGMRYVDVADRMYTFPKGVVQEINSNPRPGEVWMCLRPEHYHSRFPLYIVGDDQVKYFVSADEICEVKIDENSVKDFTKVLNADGTPV